MDQWKTHWKEQNGNQILEFGAKLLNQKLLSLQEVDYDRKWNLYLTVTK